MMQSIRVMTAVAALGLMAVAAYAADQMKPTKLFFVTNPTADAAKRRLLFASKEGPGSSNTVVGDPTVSGAKVRVSLRGGAEQCFDMPASGWSAIGPLGFRYKDFDGPGAVTAASIKKTPSGVFQIKLRISGRTGSLDVVPVAGATGFDANLTLGGGDDYCAGGATPQGATDTDRAYKVKGLPAPASCGVTACSPSGAFLDATQDILGRDPNARP
jgi:hypothetical protein